MISKFPNFLQHLNCSELFLKTGTLRVKNGTALDPAKFGIRSYNMRNEKWEIKSFARKPDILSGNPPWISGGAMDPTKLEIKSCKCSSNPSAVAILLESILHLGEKFWGKELWEKHKADQLTHLNNIPIPLPLISLVNLCTFWWKLKCGSPKNSNKYLALTRPLLQPTQWTGGVDWSLLSPYCFPPPCPWWLEHLLIKN